MDDASATAEVPTAHNNWDRYGLPADMTGKTFLDVVKEYNSDAANIILKDKRTLPTTMPWKITSKRWEQGLFHLRETTTKNARSAADLETRAKPLLKEMWDQKSLTVPNVQALEQYVSSLAPKAGPVPLFKSMKAPEVRYEPEQ